MGTDALTTVQISPTGMRLHEWIADPVRLRKILVDNPARLYDF